MKIRLSKEAVKAIEAMDAKRKQLIKDAIKGIPRGDIKPLRGKSKLFRLRAGDKRIIFSCPDNYTIIIEKIGNRGDVYKGGLFG